MNEVNQRVENNENEYENRILTEITIDYLINKKTYERLINLKKERIDDCYKKDKKFYKKRINNLTRNLMDNKKESYPNNINKAFDNYIRESIEYFKLLDETDLFQEDYIGLQLLEEMELEEEEEEKVEKINDEEIIKSFLLPKNNVPNLDNFVKIKKTQEEKIVKLPIQKEINLSDNQYKTKGISYLN
jgi:hypothetical protein